MDKIKPVAGCLRLADGRLVDPFMPKDVLDQTLWDEPETVKLYDQSAIDALRADVEKERRIAIELGVMLEAEVLRSGRAGADAKRYRWFRAGLEANHADAYDIAECAYRGGLDAAIDAAMQGGA